ncbi:MAG: aminopeptidase N [Micrococcaceae bacterium]|nr:aminopeptidase N [Micrococcaceae bacterium]MDN5879876.1 aminopeptidase N [Micrococcaceae bacterium]MDN5904834.1 aminopeptidase N [Micrococcaceae bacterium]
MENQQPRNQNLSRDEAAERARILSVDSYEVDLDLTGAPDPTVSGYRSRTRIALTAQVAGEETFLDFIHGGVASVVHNGKPLDPATAVRGSRIHFTPTAGHNLVEVDGTALYSTSGEGMHRFVDPVDGQTYLYTQYEPADARRVFANFEQPDLKAPFSFTVTAPAHWHVASNQSVAERTEHDNGMATSVFAPTLPISTYITTILAGPYHYVTDSWSRRLEDGSTLTVPLGLSCRASLAASFDADALFTTTRQGLDFFHDLFDYPYPWGKYDQAFVPEYNLGAMENPGLVTFTENYVFTSRATESQYEGRANTIMHEMAHMWFGDLVTMRWWDDLWLKESFADFIGTLAVAEATDFDTAWVTFANRRKAWAYVQDQLPTTHPIVADIPDLEAARQNFDGITYAKGASVLKQLDAYVGREAFVSAARTYFRRHEYGNTTLADFLAVLAEASGRDMGAWSESWLRTAGVGSLEVEFEEHDGAVTSAVIVQEGADPTTGSPAIRPHTLGLGTFELRDGKLERTGGFRLDATGARTEIPELVGRPRPAVVLPNDGDLTYAKVRFDESSLQVLLEHLGTLTEPLSRATAWAALWSMVRDGLLPAPVFLSAVRRHVSTITDVGVLSMILGQAETAVQRYCPPHVRDAEHRQLAQSLHDFLLAADPGSDAQLAFARALAELARAGELDHVVAGLLDGSLRVEGLTVDEQLRWALLQAGAARGHISTSTLEAERQANPSAVATVGQALAWAARPEAQVKQAAFDAALSGTDADGAVLSNDVLSATVNGFLIGSHEQIDGYYERYWPALADIWEKMSIGLATRIVQGLFPLDQDLGTEAPEQHRVVRSADAWLADHAEAPRALRRIIIEQRDQLVRTLHGQAAVLASRD